MRKILLPVLIFLFDTAYTQPEVSLEIKDHYGKEAAATVQILNMYHFSHLTLNDSLSSAILDSYIDALDRSHLYFYKSDIDVFNLKYKYSLDDLTERGDVSPAFSIYKVFLNRFNEKMDFVIDSLIYFPFDLTVDEYYDVERENVPFAETEEELNDFWRKLVKNQYLGLKLSGKNDSSIVKQLEKRYTRLKNTFSKYRNDDVFQLYLNAVAEAYDPHTNYFSPSQSERFRQDISLSLEGIGARLTMENEFIKIVEVLPGGPAFKSKSLNAGDRIVGVGQGENGDLENVVGWRVDDAVKIIKGPKGTFVRLEILPVGEGINGPTKLITLQREKIKLEDQAAESKVYEINKDGHDYKMGVISIPSFYLDFEAFQKGDPNYNSTTKDVQKLIEDMKVKQVDGIVIDLRNNGGGSLKEAIELTGLFIEEGPVVQVKNSLNKVEVAKDENEQIVWDGPLTVLINRFSASASEIFSAAIQDYKRGVVVGEQSFGKGTVQSIVPLARFIPNQKDELGQIKLTLQKFYRINGSSTQHLGVSPDITLPSPFNAQDFGESSKPAALPWDQIESTDYRPKQSISNELIKMLTLNHNKRLKNDPFMLELTQEVKDITNSMDETRISLNEEKRKKQLDKIEKEKADRVKLEGKIVVEGDREDKIEIEDKYLRESIIILSEIIVNTIG